MVQVARREREKQRLINAAEAKAEEAAAAADAAAAGAPAPGNGGRSADPAQLSDGGDEVRQCLEHIISVCIAGAGAGAGASAGVERGDGDDTRLDSGIVSVEEATDASGIRVGREDQYEPEPLLPGFELSANERKKVTQLSLSCHVLPQNNNDQMSDRPLVKRCRRGNFALR